MATILIQLSVMVSSTHCSDRGSRRSSKVRNADVDAPRRRCTRQCSMSTECPGVGAGPGHLRDGPGQGGFHRRGEPAGGPAPDADLAAVIEAFQCLEFHSVRQLGRAVPGGLDQLIESDESSAGQGDDELCQV